MPTRSLVSLVAAALLSVAAVATAAAAGPAPVVLQGEPGIPLARGAHVAAVAQGSGTTRISLVRDRDGAVIRSRILPGKLGVPAITFDRLVEETWAQGRRLVLASSIYDDASRTTFVAIDTRTLAPLRTIRLRGSFAFDALSPDGRRLYVLHDPHGANGGVRYVVRSVNLGTGRLEPRAIVDKTAPGERMSGITPNCAWSRDGMWRTRPTTAARHTPSSTLSTPARAPRGASTCPGRAGSRASSTGSSWP